MRFSSNRVDDAGSGNRRDRRPRDEQCSGEDHDTGESGPRTPKHYVFKPLAVDHRPERPDSGCEISVTIAPPGVKINRIYRFFSLFFREPSRERVRRGKMRRRQSRANHSVNMAATMGAVVVPPESPSSTTAAKLRSSPVFGCVTKPLNQVFLDVIVVTPTSAVPVFA